jgi:hypothetical protein
MSTIRRVIETIRCFGKELILYLLFLPSAVLIPVEKGGRSQLGRKDH